MSRNILFVVLGMVLMYVLLSAMSKTSSSSNTWLAVKRLAKNQKTINLIKTNEFREVVKTNEFSDLLKTLANDQIKSISQTLISG